MYCNYDLQELDRYKIETIIWFKMNNNVKSILLWISSQMKSRDKKRSMNEQNVINGKLYTIIIFYTPFYVLISDHNEKNTAHFALLPKAFCAPGMWW